MAETLESIKAKLALAIQDEGSVLASGAGEEMESAIRESVEQYSRDLPREVVVDITGDGATFDLTIPAANYSDGFSRVISVEYPAGERVPLYIDGNEWTIYRTATTARLRLTTITPGASETVRVTHTARHTLSGIDAALATTIPDWHANAFVNLCAAHCLFRMAARFLHEQETTLHADSVDRGNKCETARRLGGALMRSYQEQLGLSGGESPALRVVDWDSSVHSGLYGLTHGRRLT